MEFRRLICRSIREGKKKERGRERGVKLASSRGGGGEKEGGEVMAMMNGLWLIRGSQVCL